MGRLAGGGKPDTGRVGGRYRLIERLGTGGMSVVWRGYDEILGRPVAVKVLSPRLAADEGFRDRLRQEALAAARLCHPNITGVFDFGESPLTSRLTVPYVVMELHDGESLAARLSRRGPLDWRSAVVIAAEVASALATAHARGVVHRDVTPANVMLTAAGAKVVDFGISALVGQRDAAPDGSVLGTPAYLAPERLGGGQVSPATDVYALGLLLYRALTARLPWSAATTTEVLRAHLYADPEPVPPIAGLPAEVAALCLRCLAKRPVDRPAAAELARVLGALVGLGMPPETRVAPLSGCRATEPIPAGGRHATARPGRSATLRLRAGIRIATVLRLGAVRSLGGGLFAGGGLARHPRQKHRAAGRGRWQAAAAGVVLLAALGASWAAAREPADAGPAQAAAGPVSPRPVGCKIRYQVRQDDGADFEALVTVANTGRRPLVGWRVEFSYPGTQRLVGLPRTAEQNGRRVLLRAATAQGLRPGRTATVTLRGAYRETNPLPLAFHLNGRACDAEVLGPTTVKVTGL